MKNSHYLLLTTFLFGLFTPYTLAESFESSTGGWKSDAPASSRILTVAEGAPKEAVTDGDSCLELTSDNGKDWCQLAVQKGLLEDIRNSEVLTFDLFVPQSSLPENGWAKVQVRLFGGKGDGASFDLTEDVDLVLNEDKSYRVEWNYAAQDTFHAAVHIKDGGPTSVKPPTPYGHIKFDSDLWHTWGLHWTKDRQVFYLDGKPYWVNTKNVSTAEDHGLRMTIEISNGDPENGNKKKLGSCGWKVRGQSGIPVAFARIYRLRESV